MAGLYRTVKSKTQQVVGVALGVAFAGSMYPNTLGLNSYRKLTSMYKDGEPVPVIQSLKDLVQQVLLDISMDPTKEVNIEFYMAHGQNIIHRGSCNARTGAVVGLPGNFTFTDMKEVEKEQVQVSGQLIDWNSPDGAELQDAMVLSDNAKRFGIARELHYTLHHHVLVKPVMQMGFAFGAYASGFALSNLFALRNRLKGWARVVVYGAVACTWGAFYLTVRDAYEQRRDIKADRHAAELAYSYALGGVEFYDKILTRNIAIRKLMKHEGEKLYTVYGNDVVTWRQPHVQYSRRLDLMKKIVEKYKSGEIKGTAHISKPFKKGPFSF